MTDSLLDDIRALVACGPRIAGSGAEAAATDYILSELAAAGLAPERLRFDAWLSLPQGAAVVDLPDGRQIAGKGTAFAADGVVSGPAKRLSDPGPLTGAIAIVDGLPHLHLLDQAAARGAVGVIAVSPDDHAHYWQISPLWGSPRNPTDLHRFATIPALQIAKRDAAALFDVGPLRLTARVDSGWRPVQMPAVRIPGREGPKILIGGHFCSWGPGASDNAAGAALMLAIARHYAKAPQPRFGLRLAWWTGHEQGGYAGSTHYADRFHAQLSRDAFAYLSVDNVGSRGASVWQVQNTAAELHAFAADLRDRLAPLGAQADFAASLLPTRADRGIPASRPARNGDQSFVGAGLSSLQVASWLGPDTPDRIPGTGLPWWWHTDDDLPEYCDPEVLARDLALNLALVEGLVNAETLPLDPAAQANDLVAVLTAYAEAAPLLADLLALAQSYAHALTDAPLTDTRRIALVKALTPTLFQAADPAEVDMTRQSALLPDLRPALDWPTAAPGARAFLTLTLTRAANRTARAIRQALALLETPL